MSVYTFTDTTENLEDLIYELNDDEILNDIYAITGGVGEELITRGYDVGSIAKYARRTLRIDRPVLLDGDTATSIVTLMLDRSIEPYPFFILKFKPISAAMTVMALGLKLSDKITVNSAILGFNDDCIVEGIEMIVDKSVVRLMVVKAVQCRANE